jgi:hypothetical protein
MRIHTTPTGVLEPLRMYASRISWFRWRVVVKVLRMDGTVRAVWVTVLSDLEQNLDDMMAGELENQRTRNLKDCLL